MKHTCRVRRQLIRKGEYITILAVGADLAKNVFALCGVNDHGNAELVRPTVPRDKLRADVASLSPCTDWHQGVPDTTCVHPGTLT